MKEFKYSADYNDRLLAELYDQEEDYTEDVALLKYLIGEREHLNILECFCGTGRILVPLAQDGHRITGLEMASAMLERAQMKINQLGQVIKENTTLIEKDVLEGNWGSGYDLVIIGCNALYELPSPKEQEKCIQLAWEALASGGRLFIDINNYKGDWGKTEIGCKRVVFEGYGSNGDYGRYTMEGLDFDEDKDILYMKRSMYVKTPEGRENTTEYVGKKHPVTYQEVETWLKKSDFRIREVYGNYQQKEFVKEDDRAIFWAEKP